MIVIYAEQKSNRLEYIVNELFKHMYGMEVRLEYEADQFYTLPDNQPKVCYAYEHIGRSLHIKPAEILYEKGIREQTEIDVEQWEGHTFMFRTGKDHPDTIPYDIFAASFYLLSRYEEYLPHEKDRHGRYKATDSLAYKQNFLEEPVVDQWMQTALNRLYELFPDIEHSKRHFRYLKTIDVDNVYAYRHKGLLINGMHAVADLMSGKSRQAKQRLKAVMRVEKDPYFNIEEMAATHAPYAKDTLFFFHCGCYGKYDKKVWLPSLHYAIARKNISKTFGVGLHPSYRSAHNARLFNIEKSLLEFHTGQQIQLCRSHYLLFNLPNDYRMLESNGITDDYTMGYSNNAGFRAGTSLPFHFYDLQEERASKLVIHPFCIMDKTLHANMGLDADAAKHYVLEMAKKVKAVNGEFVTIFHNENQTDAEGFGWEGWSAMYKELLQELG